VAREAAAALTLPTRRQFIKVGIAGGAVLVTARWLGGPAAAPAPGHRFLDEAGAAIVAAFVPVVLEGSLPVEGPSRARAVVDVVAAFDRAVAGLSPAVQEEVDQLFGVLRFPPTRLAFTGLWQPVPESTPAQVAAFLTRWRRSRFEIQRAGYQAITQLVQASWYDNPVSWAAIGYPGPPPLAR
jgi:hypothetical protein